MAGWYAGKAKGLSQLYFHAQDAGKPRTALTYSRNGVFLFLLSLACSLEYLRTERLLSATVFFLLSLMRAAELNL